jgi:hypothetical protein
LSTSIAKPARSRCGHGAAYAANFQFAILEVAGTFSADVLEREAHWKRVLLTRDHGLNSN